ncbi:hypothetical protein BBP40_001378 [Aspergillus hancockii]|nr:hypothetical protein BBP40_001378 [Aspergillus hancockii]
MTHAVQSVQLCPLKGLLIRSREKSKLGPQPNPDPDRWDETRTRRCPAGSYPPATHAVRLSPGNRLGRPKGSKNKRTLIQQYLNLNKEQRSEIQGSSVDVMHWIESGQQPQEQGQQQQPELDLIEFEFDMDQAFDTTMAFGEGDSPIGDGSRDLMLDMGLGLVESLSADDNSGLSHQACFAQASRVHVSGQLPVSESALGQFNTFPSGGSADPNGIFFSSNNPARSRYSRASSFSPASPPSATSGPPSKVQSGCVCLQRLVRLLYHLEELRFPPAHGQGHAPRAHHSVGPSADSVLRGVQAAKTTWKCLMHCSVPDDDDNHREALLLFAMSIRILLLAVQRLNNTISPHQIELSSDIAVSVGSFELMGEAKAEIIGVVVRRALWAITIALQHLWEHAGQPTTQTASEPGRISPKISSPMDILNGSSAGEAPQTRPRAFSAPASTTGFGAEDEHIVSLLATLQCTMKVLEQETHGSGAGPEQRPSPI